MDISYKALVFSCTKFTGGNPKPKHDALAVLNFEIFFVQAPFNSAGKISFEIGLIKTTFMGNFPENLTCRSPKRNHICEFEIYCPNPLSFFWHLVVEFALSAR